MSSPGLAAVMVALLLAGCDRTAQQRPTDASVGLHPPRVDGGGDGATEGQRDVAAEAEPVDAEPGRDVVGVGDAGAIEADAAAAPTPAPPCRTRSLGAGLRALGAASGSGHVVAGYDDGRIAVFDRNLVQQRTLTPAGAVHGLAVSDDGAFVALAHDDRSLRVLSVADDRVLWSSPAPPSAIHVVPTGLDFSADGRDLLVQVGGSVRLVHRDSGRLLWSDGLVDDVERSAGVAFLREDDGTVFIHTRGGADLRRRADGTLVRQLRMDFAGYLAYFLPSPRGDVLVGRDGAGTQLLVARSADLAVVARLPGAFLNPLAFTPDGRMLLTEAEVAVAGSAAPARVVQPWNVADWTPLPPWGDRRDQALVATGPAPQQVLVADRAGGVRLIDARAGDAAGAELVGRGHDRQVVDLEYAPDGRWLVSLGDGIGDRSALLVWGADAEAPSFAILGVPDKSHVFAFSSDSRWLHVVRANGDLELYEVATGKRDRRSATAVTCVATGADADAFYTCGADRRLREHRLSDGSVRVMPPELPIGASALAIAPRAGTALVAGERGAFALIRLSDGQTRWEHHEPRASGPASLAFSPDETLVAATVRWSSRTLLLLDAATGAVVQNSLEYDTRGTAAFAPGGRLLAVGTIDGAKLLRLPERSHVHTLAQRRPGGGRMGIAFAPAGDQLAMGLLWGRTDVVCDLAARFAP